MKTARQVAAFALVFAAVVAFGFWLNRDAQLQTPYTVGSYR